MKRYIVGLEGQGRLLHGLMVLWVSHGPCEVLIYEGYYRFVWMRKAILGD